MLLGHKGLISGFALVDSKLHAKIYLISVSWDRRICVWFVLDVMWWFAIATISMFRDLQRAASTCSHKVQDYFSGKGWSDQSRCLVTVFRSPAAAEDAARRRPGEHDAALEEIACDGFIRDVCYSSTRNEFAYASSDGVVYIRAFALLGEDMTLKGTLLGHHAEVVKVCFATTSA